MLRGGNGAVWMENKEDDVDSASWTRTKITTTTTNNNNSGNAIDNNRDEMGSLSSFKSMIEVEDDWYVTAHNNNAMLQNHNNEIRDLTTFSPENLLLQAVDSSSSCSPSSSVFNNLTDPSQGQYFLAPKQTLSSLLNIVSNNPLDHPFDLGELGFVENQNQAMGGSLNLQTRGGSGILGNFTDLSSNNQISNLNLSNFCSDAQFSATRMVHLPENSVGFSGFRGFDDNCGNALFMNRSKLLRPLETFPSVGAQPTLFQKRAASRKNLAENNSHLGFSGISDGSVSELDKGKKKVGEENEKRRKIGNVDDFEDISVDASALNYDSDELTENNNNNNGSKIEETGKNGGNSSNANSTVTGCGDQKGKKKGMPAKNLMAERRRRKKLNDRLYMLRSVVPKISKMDRASILGDAIEYLKELLQKINDLHNELESSTPPGSSLAATTPTASFHPLTPTPSTLPSRIKDEICPRSLPSPNGQPARVEVRVREGRAVNIHMLCSRRPGLLLSTMRALDNLGLDIQQAVISCFNGFAMDIFRAECKEQDVQPERIKAVLLDSAGFHGLL